MAESLTLTPLGVGAAYGRPTEAQSAYLVRYGRSAVCLDLGAGTFNALLGHVTPDELNAVVVTHAHPDHCADLLSMRVYMAWGPGRGHVVRVLAAPGVREALVGFTGDEWPGVAFEELTPGPVPLGAMTLTAAEVPHVGVTYAVRIDVPGGSLTFSADCAPNAALPDLARDTDLLLAECAHGDQPLPPVPIHLNGTEAGRIARQAGAGRLMLTHCYPEYDRPAALDAAAAAFGGPVEWARQGEEVTVSAG